MKQDKIKERFYQKKWVRITALTLVILVLIFLCSFIPALSLKTNGMKELKGEYITIYYETEETAAKDVFELANAESERIAKSLGFDFPQEIKMYIYDQQSTFQTKKYGLIALLLNLDWYIGDNRGTNVLLTSPANPGKEHDYDDIKQVSIHEMVHAYNSIVNKNMTLWINEGLAGYLSGQNPHDYDYKAWHIPTVKEMQTSNPVTFSEMGGYPLSYIYIEYLSEAFGWDNILTLADTNDFEKAFGKDESEIYDEWIKFTYDNYP